MNKYYADFLNWINKVSLVSIIIVCVCIFLLASAESLYLTNFHPKADPYNTLRFTNILYSLIAFLFLFKIGTVNWISKLHPRNTTFGIYLIHYSVIVQGLPLIFRPLNIDYAHKSALFLFGFQLVRFIIAFAVSYLLTVLIGKSNRIKWIVGQ
ncbi:hypothetical protein EON73_04365 [bacterium]|nr:MAG: hypothetical protein EON73_04365 [bacterium]